MTAGVAPTGTADLVFGYGIPSDTPITGDWNGDGVTDIGIFRNGTWYLKNMTAGVAPTGTADLVFGYGIPGDILVTGMW
jgi:hypothetical protein